MRKSIRYNELWTEWAFDEYQARLEPKESVFIQLFFKTLESGHYAASCNFGDIGLIVVSNRLKSEKSIKEAIRHELIHIRLDSAKHGKRFARWCVKLGLNLSRHITKD